MSAVEALCSYSSLLRNIPSPAVSICLAAGYARRTTSTFLPGSVELHGMFPTESVCLLWMVMLAWYWDCVVLSKALPGSRAMHCSRYISLVGIFTFYYTCNITI